VLSGVSHGSQSVQLLLETLRLATNPEDITAAACVGRLTHQTHLLAIRPVVEHLVWVLEQPVDCWIQQRFILRVVFRDYVGVDNRDSCNDKQCKKTLGNHVDDGNVTRALQLRSVTSR